MSSRLQFRLCNKTVARQEQVTLFIATFLILCLVSSTWTRFLLVKLKNKALYPLTSFLLSEISLLIQAYLFALDPPLFFPISNLLYLFVLRVLKWALRREKSDYCWSLPL